jgi:biotin carboxyl carrier protein
MAAQGDRVKEGQELLIIESMKMEIPVEATATGVVASVLVGEKSPIDVGDVLITLESD